MKLLSGELGNIIEFIMDNETNTNQTIIWLTEDQTSMFNDKFINSDAWIPGLIIIIILSILVPLGCYKYYMNTDKKKRFEKMRKMGINITSKKDIISILNPHCNYNKDLIQIIYEYTADDFAENEQKLLNHSYEILTTSIIDSHTGKEFLKLRTFQYLLITLILIPAYFPLFYSIEHLDDSYKSYIKIDCIYDAVDKACVESEDEDDCEYRWEFDFEGANICNDEIDDYDKYEFVGKYASYEGEICYVNKDTFKFRGNDGMDQWCCCVAEPCGRCGNIECFGCQCPNCWGYFCCLIPMIMLFICYFCLIGQMQNYDLDREYVIKPIQGHGVSMRSVSLKML